EPVEGRIAALERGYRPQRLRVVIEAANAGEAAVERPLAGMAERRGAPRGPRGHRPKAGPRRRPSARARAGAPGARPRVGGGEAVGGERKRGVLGGGGEAAGEGRVRSGRGGKWLGGGRGGGARRPGRLGGGRDAWGARGGSPATPILVPPPRRWTRGQLTRA